MSEVELKPCPFCGEHLERCETPRLLYQHPYSKNGCFLRGYIVGGSDIAAWNTRKPMEGIVEQLEKRDCYLNAIEIVQKGGAE